jgi:uncharacterized protein YybS (DUF2232 family)
VPYSIQWEVPKDVAAGILVTSVIFMISVFMPVIGFFCTIFIPLPILFYRAKLGRKWGLFIPGGCLVVMGLVLGKVSFDIFFFMELMLLGFILSELFEKNLSVEKTILLSCAGVLGTAAAGVLVYGFSSNQPIIVLVSQYIAKNLELTIGLYRGMGIPEDTIATIESSLDQIQYVLTRMIPALVSCSILVVAWTNVLLARPIFASRKLAYPEFGQLNSWKAPENLIWMVIVSGLLLLIPARGIKMIGINGLFILLTVYFFQGIAIVSFFFNKKNFPRLARFILYGLIVIQQFFLLGVIALGLFDMWLDFRKLTPKPN